jgi:hypothetical protein
MGVGGGGCQTSSSTKKREKGYTGWVWGCHHAATALYEPAGHGVVQAVTPVDAEKVPAAHGYLALPTQK